MATTIGHMAVMVSANSSGFTAGFATMSNTLGGFITSLGKLGAIAGVVGGVGEGIKKAFGGFAEMESNQVAFETLLGSAAKAKTLMGDLAKFGAETPFQLPELTAAGKNLAAFGMSAEDIVPKLRRIGDIASLLNQPIGEMATLYGKAKVAGVLMSEDINQFTERGVPLIGQLAQQFGVAESSVKKLASEGKISFADMDRALTALTSEGGRFAGGMEKQSQTLGGLWSTLTDNVGQSLVSLGGGLVSLFSGKDAISGLGEFTASIQSTLATWAESVGNAVPYMQQIFQTLGSVIGAVWEGISLGGQALVGTLGMIFDGMGVSVINFKELFVEGLLHVRFFFQNFGDYMEIGWNKFTFSLIYAFNNMHHIFTVSIPEILSWFSRNWVNVFTDVWNFTVTIFTNIGKNIWEFFKNIPGLISGTTSFAEIWTPLTEGFKSSVTEALVLTRRELTNWEKEQLKRVDTLEGNLAQKKDEWMNKERAQFASDLAKANTPAAVIAAEAQKSPATAAAAASSKMQETKYTGAIEAGSKEAYNVILRSRDFNGPAQQTATATKKLVKQAEKAEEQFDEIITAVQDFGDQFGGLGLDDGSNL